jgi:tryptophan synthase alpha chain
MTLEKTQTRSRPPVAQGNKPHKLGIYWTLGDPTLEETLAIARALVDEGVDLLELGLPFSDPLLDGPLIQQSHHRVTTAGTTFNAVCSCLQQVTGYAHKHGTEVSVMAASQLLYDNTRRAALPTVDGLLITDISSHKMSPFPMPSPRVYFVSQEVVLSPAFKGLPNEPMSMIYLTRVQGITGAGQEASATTARAVAKLREWSQLPLWLGFGISTPQDLAQCMAAGADGGIIGSAFLAAMLPHVLASKGGGSKVPWREVVAEWLAPFRAANTG